MSNFRYQKLVFEDSPWGEKRLWCCEGMIEWTRKWSASCKQEVKGIDAFVLKGIESLTGMSSNNNEKLQRKESLNQIYAEVSMIMLYHSIW